MAAAYHQKKSNFSRLEKLIDYKFNNINLLKEALTHRSAGAGNNERLEFLGDSVLNFVIAADLFERYPTSSEGDLSRLRASLVNKDGLYLVSQDLKLGDYLILGSGELKSGGHRRNSILADTVEAILGAVYIDGDFERCHSLILQLYSDQLKNIPDANSLKDPKTRLQELLQSRKFGLPEYDVIEIVGKAHNQQFTVSCKINKLNLQTQGKASNRRKAEQLAANLIIEQVETLFKKKK